jgi:hypothetical protein
MLQNQPTKVLFFKRIVFNGFALFIGSLSFGQNMESITFSAVASTNNNFQPVVGTPYGASLSGANGSLEISSSYGESSYEESSLSVEELTLKTNLRIYPNPATYQVIVDLTQLPQGEYQLFLMDLSGKVVYSQTVQAISVHLDMSTYASGTYVLRIQTNETRKVETFKFVKK